MSLTPAHTQSQVAQPFPLADEVLLGVRRVTGAHARVYDLLRQAAERGVRFAVGEHAGPPGWVPNYVLRQPWSGGDSGDRRARQLRTDYGVDVDVERYVRPDGRKSSTFLYRLASPAIAVVPAPPAATATEARTANGRRRPQPGDQPLRFFTHVGNPAGAEGVCMAPGHHAAAPDRAMTQLLVRGTLTPAGAVARYEETLRKAYAARQLDPLLALEGEVVLWTWPHLPFDPLPTLARVLELCGATYLGPWRGADKRIA